jgi:dTDP-4-amino-4,6-dideoxygalactose transaminase
MTTGTDHKLALHGGRPALDRPLDQYKGASVIGAEERAAVLEVLDSRSLFRYYGPDLQGKVAAFEENFAAFVGARYAAAAANGTAALRMGLAGLGVGPGDEVIVPAVTFIASVGAVVANRARPVFAEVDENMQLDPSALQRALTPRTKAIMPVHLAGSAVDMEPVVEFARAQRRRRHPRHGRSRNLPARRDLFRPGRPVLDLPQGRA